MTPERREYLHSISKEEIYVRFALLTVRNKLSIAKPNKSLGYLGETDTEIQDYKTIIKALKKQLSQKLIYVSANEDNIHWCLNCPACHYTIFPSNFAMSFFRNYCPCCGQKLR